MTDNQNAVPAPAVSQAAVKREFSVREKWLLLIALALGVLWDRLIFYEIGWRRLEVYYSAFWLAYLVMLYAFYWERLKRSWVLWYIGVCGALLCVWNFIFPQIDYDLMANNSYRDWTIFVIPCVLMAHAQYAAGDYKLKEAGKLAKSWLLGWTLKPFSGIAACLGVIYSSISGSRRRNAVKILIAIAILIPIMAVLTALLSEADLMFGYHIRKIFNDFDFAYVIRHTVAVIIIFMLFYSFLWNIGYGVSVKIEIQRKVAKDSARWEKKSEKA
ncbi:MAG: hypothetical protein LBT88_05300, partial [Oscillospiraceae bacterium]|nr:hypothetical protein [Oscillospiraceae bacterium]